MKKEAVGDYSEFMQAPQWIRPHRENPPAASCKVKLSPPLVGVFFMLQCRD